MKPTDQEIIATEEIYYSQFLRGESIPHRATGENTEVGFRKRPGMSGPKPLRGESGSGPGLASLNSFSRLWSVGAVPTYLAPKVIRAGG